MHFHAIVKASRVSHVSHGNFGQPDHYWAALKYIFLGPETRFQFQFLSSPVPFYSVSVLLCAVAHASRLHEIDQKIVQEIDQKYEDLKYAERYKKRANLVMYRHSLREKDCGFTPSLHFNPVFTKFNHRITAYKPIYQRICSTSRELVSMIISSQY